MILMDRDGILNAFWLANARTEQVIAEVFMAEVETTKISDFGDMVVEPGCSLISSDEYYRMLLAALDLGWQVEEPVYLRPRWNEGDRWVFHFILKKNSIDQPRLLTTGHTPEIERLVFEEGWQVDRLPIKENSSFSEIRHANYCGK